MLEILFLVFLVRKLSALAKSKGRSGGWGALGAGFYIGGELTGFIVGGIADLGMGSYLVALAFAAMGALASWLIVRSLSSAYANPYGYVNPPPTMAPAVGYPNYDPSNPYSPPRA